MNLPFMMYHVILMFFYVRYKIVDVYDVSLGCVVMYPCLVSICADTSSHTHPYSTQKHVGLVLDSHMRSSGTSTTLNRTYVHLYV